MSEEEGAVVGCFRVSGLERPHPESVSMPCSRCGVLIWVHPTSLIISAEKNAPLICTEHLAEMRADGEDLKLGIHPLQRPDWRDYLRSLGGSYRP